MARYVHFQSIAQIQLYIYIGADKTVKCNSRNMGQADIGHSMPKKQGHQILQSLCSDALTSPKNCDMFFQLPWLNINSLHFCLAFLYARQCRLSQSAAFRQEGPRSIIQNQVTLGYTFTSNSLVKEPWCWYRRRWSSDAKLISTTFPVGCTSSWATMVTFGLPPCLLKKGPSLCRVWR